MKKRFLFSVLLGIAIIGLGNDKVDAASVYSDTLPDTITTAADAPSYVFKNGIDPDKIDESKSNYPFYALDTTGNYMLFCSDRLLGELQPSKTLTKDKELDSGIAYILMNSYPTIASETRTTNPETTDPVILNMANIWVTQAAIWAYQGSMSYDELSTLELDLVKVGQTTPPDYAITGVSASALWNTYVATLVQDAKKAVNTVSGTDTLKFTINDGDNWTIDKETGIAKSPLITLTSSAENVDLTSYKLSMENAPENTKVYDENGNDITSSINNMSVTKFYIVVDTNKQETDATFKISATGPKLTYQTAYQYVDKGTQCKNSTGASVQCQPTVLVGPASKELAASIDLNVTYAPDTASGISKSVYILGFIILICGAFIIYANVKPKQDEIQI